MWFGVFEGGGEVVWGFRGLGHTRIAWVFVSFWRFGVVLGCIGEVVLGYV